MKNVFMLSAAFAFGLAGCQSKTASAPEVSSLNAQMAPAINPSAKGMVAAANPHAVEAGLQALRAGGSAIDAAIAVQTVLSLVEPQSSGIGGGAFMVFYDAKSGKVVSYNGRETAPAAIDENLFLDAEGNPVRRVEGIISGKSTGAPGVMAMLDMAHNDYGKLAWGDNFNFAIKLAEDGFEVSPRMAMLVEMASKYALTVQPEARAYFFHEDGSPIEAGFPP